MIIAMRDPTSQDKEDFSFFWFNQENHPYKVFFYGYPHDGWNFYGKLYIEGKDDNHWVSCDERLPSEEERLKYNQFRIWISHWNREQHAYFKENLWYQDPACEFPFRFHPNSFSQELITHWQAVIPPEIKK